MAWTVPINIERNPNSVPLDQLTRPRTPAPSAGVPYCPDCVAAVIGGKSLSSHLRKHHAHSVIVPRSQGCKTCIASTVGIPLSPRFSCREFATPFTLASQSMQVKLFSMPSPNEELPNCVGCSWTTIVFPPVNGSWAGCTPARPALSRGPSFPWMEGCRSLPESGCLVPFLSKPAVVGRLQDFLVSPSSTKP